MPAARPARGFTLLEVVIVIVVIGILAAIAAASYDAVLGRSEDSSGQATVVSIARQAQGLAALRDLDTPGVDEMTEATADADANADDVSFALVEDLPDDGEAGSSLVHGQVSFATARTDAPEIAAVAMRAETGHCVMVLVDGVTDVTAWTVEADLGAGCAALQAFKGPSGSYPPA